MERAGITDGTNGKGEQANIFRLGGLSEDAFQRRRRREKKCITAEASEMGWRKCCTVVPLALSSMAPVEWAMAGGPPCRLKVLHLPDPLRRQSWLAMYGR